MDDKATPVWLDHSRFTNLICSSWISVSQLTFTCTISNSCLRRHINHEKKTVILLTPVLTQNCSRYGTDGVVGRENGTVSNSTSN